MSEVISQAKRALSISPRHTNLYILKILAHHAQQDFKQVTETTNLLASVTGPDSTTNFLLGLAAFCDRRFDHAFCYLEKSAQEDAFNPFTWSYLARTAFETGSLEQAVAFYRAALELAPDHQPARSELAFCLQIMGRHPDAIEHLDLLIQRSPSPGLLTRKLKSVQYMCDFRSYRELIPSIHFTSEHPLHPITNIALNVSAQQLCDNAVAFATRNCSAEKINIDHSPIRSAKIRLGYFSNDFHTHATTVLLGNMFALHNRSHFEVIGFDFTTTADLVTQEVRSTFDEYYPIHTLPDRSVADLSREKRIDIAIDLKGWTLNARPNIFQHRAAPIQIAYLGFPGTSGMREIDYIVADPIVIPEHHRSFYTERILYMPECYQINARSSSAPCERATIRSQYGLPDDAFVFCSFNNSFKITPELFEAWMKILAAVPQSIFWVLLDNDEARTNLHLEASRLGLNPSRILFAHSTDHSEHLRRLSAADLFLDTWYYNAHTTASDALWAGLPLLTLCGETFASRVATSILTAAGLPELVTYSADEYVNKAVGLARSPSALTALRARAEAQRTTSPLFDSQRWVCNFEQLLLRAVEHYNRGSQPATIATL